MSNYLNRIADQLSAAALELELHATTSRRNGLRLELWSKHFREDAKDFYLLAMADAATEAAGTLAAR